MLDCLSGPTQMFWLSSNYVEYELYKLEMRYDEAQIWAMNLKHVQLLLTGMLWYVKHMPLVLLHGYPMSFVEIFIWVFKLKDIFICISIFDIMLPGLVLQGPHMVVWRIQNWHTLEVSSCGQAAIEFRC